MQALFCYRELLKESYVFRILNASNRCPNGVGVQLKPEKVSCVVRQIDVQSLQEFTMQTHTTTETSRDSRLEARISRTQKNLFQQAATLSGRSLTEFVVASAQEAAVRVIEEHETIRLTRAEQQAFVEALIDPPAPNARLLQAARTYRLQLGL